MKHYLIVASIWLVSAGLGFAACMVEVVRLFASDRPATVLEIVSIFVVSAFSLFALATAAGLFRGRVWARTIAIVVAVLLYLYCAGALIRVASRFGTAAYPLGWLGIVVATYTFVVVSREPSA